MKLLLTKGVSDQTSTIMIIVEAGNLSLSLFASFNVLAEHTSELFLNVAAENMLNKILKLLSQVLSTHPPICDCEGCRMASPVVSTL